MKTREKAVMWASAVVGMLSILILSGEKSPDATWESYWLVKGIALAFLGLSFVGVKSIENKIQEDE